MKDLSNKNEINEIYYLLIELFRIRKIQNNSKTIFGFGNLFFRIVKNEDLYVYGYRLFSIGYQVVYSSKNKNKIFNCYTLTIISLVINFLWIPILLIGYLPHKYYDGANNFIRDTAWYQNVRFFNWVNFLLLIILIIIFIISKL